ncbi:MAG: hypothetical protein V1892_03075 [bacterium]
MLILEEKDRKKMVSSIVVLILIILGVMGLLFFWSLSISGFSVSSVKSTISLPQFLIGSKEKIIESTNIETRIFKDSKFKALRSYEVLPIREGSFGKADPFAAPFFFSQEEFSNEEAGNSEPFR